MKPPFFIAAMLSILSGCTSNYDSWIDTGGNQYLAQNYDDAIKSFSKAISIDSTQTKAFYYRGRSEYEKKNYQKAASDFKAVTKLNSGFVDAYYYMGMSDYNLELYSESIKDFSNALKFNPTDTLSFKYRGLSNLVMDNQIEAIQDLTSYILLNSNDPEAYEVLTNIVFLLLLDKKYALFIDGIDYENIPIVLEKDKDLSLVEFAALSLKSSKVDIKLYEQLIEAQSESSGQDVALCVGVFHGLRKRFEKPD